MRLTYITTDSGSFIEVRSIRDGALLETFNVSLSKAQHTWPAAYRQQAIGAWFEKLIKEHGVIEIDCAPDAQVRAEETEAGGR